MSGVDEVSAMEVGEEVVESKCGMDRGKARGALQQ